jgi:hypothetical protein
MDTLFETVAQLLRQPEIFKEKYEFFKKVVCRWFRFAQLAKGKKFRP